MLGDILEIGVFKDLVAFQKSDIIIVQVGIVDATRRAMPRILTRVIAHTPVVGKIVHKIISFIINERDYILADSRPLKHLEVALIKL